MRLLTTAISTADCTICHVVRIDGRCFRLGDMEQKLE